MAHHHEPEPDEVEGTSATATVPEQESSSFLGDRALRFPPLEQSQVAFLSALPELLKEHRGEWVAYADGVRVRFADTQAELFRHCLTDLGLTHNRFVVRRVQPESDPHVDFHPR